MHNFMDKDNYQIWLEDKCYISLEDLFPSVLTQRCVFVLEDYKKNTKDVNLYDFYGEVHDTGVRDKVGKY